MSGIIGIYCLDGRPVDRQDLQKMVDILAHRGPDGAAIWSDGSIGFGHRMLWTTPESLIEKLPLIKNDLIITADARIDNRDELQSVLDLPDRPIEKITDSEFILAAYEKWGEDCPKHLLGDFAFAIWDKRKHQLFCARDHFGVKPFYYYLSQDFLVFATEIKGIVCLSQVSPQLNEKRVAEYLSLLKLDVSITFYEDILRLPPAHIMTVNCEGKHLQRYWFLDLKRELRLNSDQEYASAFREIFTEAVRCRLRSAFPVGSMLSGGLDSSSIACVAKRFVNQTKAGKLPTFSAIHNQVAECDESIYQNAVLIQGGFEPHRLDIDRLSPLMDLEQVLWHQDEVQEHGNLYAPWGCYGIAQRQGVRIMLEGFDGDTTVSHGKGYLIELAQAGHWFTLASEVKALSKKLNTPWRKALWAWIRIYGIKPLISRNIVLRSIRRVWIALAKRKSRRTPLSNAVSVPNPIISLSFVRRINLSSDFRDPLNQPKTEREAHYRRLTDPGECHTLEKINSAVSAFCIESRFPFWDKRLVEFCLSLPPNQKLRSGWGRFVMRQAMEGILPKEVQWRGNKTDHSAGFNYGLLTFERERLEEMLLKNPSVIEPYVNTVALREACQRFLSGQATDFEALMIWKVLSLALWLKSSGLQMSTADYKEVMYP